MSKQESEAKQSENEPMSEEMLHLLECEAKLLRCPFCGSKGRMSNVRMSNHTFRVYCATEGCLLWNKDTYFDTSFSAIDAWNTRADAGYAPDKLVSRFEAARGVKLWEPDRNNLVKLVDASLSAARTAALEQAAKVAEAPYTGQAHGDYARGKADRSNEVARNIRALLPTQHEKRTRRLTAEEPQETK